jgi:hypothetical protein
MSVQAATRPDVFTHRASVHSICDAPGFADRLEETYASMNEGPRCIKGILMAIGLQSAVVLGMIAGWQLWHILR